MSLVDDLHLIEDEALKDLTAAVSLSDIEAISVKYLGRKEGKLTGVLRNLGTLPPEEKKQVGQNANQLRELLDGKIIERKKDFESKALESQLEKEKLDATLPGTQHTHGLSHPILSTLRELLGVFRELGFSVVQGPEIETDENNFGSLNIPDNHPARDMHDTFYLNLKEEKTNRPFLLRTHTSPVQIRLMKSIQPPVRVVVPGRVFRHEAVDATHAAIFHQLEGLAIDTDISFADLKGTLTSFAKRYFGSDTKVRFRPSYFPFVEPGAEMDIEWNGKWLEILGAGMVHPQVLRNVGYNPEKVSGFAFGMGVDRSVMKRYQIPDIRYLLESDLRFLEQFK